ncbi:MAG TPA: enolase C-terminal domain-like protein [Stellaceae bacterium]|jgi:L-alanine-DL-glutamate epimerase-like enolase superfamily enzyme|nr:enolase C-terminal domain-like protein [Stellaceae bacterium]
MRTEAPISRVAASAYVIPTDAPEGDGTLEWDSTTLVVVEIEAAGETGLGYTYSNESIASVIEKKLAETIAGHSALDIAGAGAAMWRAIRNLGRSGLVATAISAVDTALWDLKAKLLGLPVAVLLGRCRDSVAIYGSGGFTTYADERLRDQLAGWVERDGCRAVKMKIGTEPERDPARVKTARRAIGDAALFVDANGAFSAKEALGLAARIAEHDVTWFEEPVSSDDLSGLALMRSRAPEGMDIAAGEYGYNLDDFHRLLPAVDVLQADVTRCGGITGFMQAAALCEAHHVDLSGHCAPALHLHAACAAPRLRHLEWFHDHVRIEHMLFDGAPLPRDGRIAPDLSRPGFGLDFKTRDAQRFRVH